MGSFIQSAPPKPGLVTINPSIAIGGNGRSAAATGLDRFKRIYICGRWTSNANNVDARLRFGNSTGFIETGYDSRNQDYNTSVRVTNGCILQNTTNRNECFFAADITFSALRAYCVSSANANPTAAYVTNGKHALDAVGGLPFDRISLRATADNSQGFSYLDMTIYGQE